MTELKKVTYKNFTIEKFIDFTIYNLNGNKIVTVESLLEAFKLVDYLAECDTIELKELDDEEE